MATKISKEISVLYETEVDLNVNDFLNCHTIHELEFDIIRKFDPAPKIKEKHSINREKIKIDKDFLCRWKEAVGFLPKNVMTLEWKNLRVSQADEIKEYDGCQLNNNNYRDFSLGDYEGFHFSDEKRYKCYLSVNDRDYYVTTHLLYAEECGPSIFKGTNTILS